MSTHTCRSLSCVVSLETAASANRILFSHLSVSEKLMKPSATAVRATKWLLINSLLSRGTITPQPDIRNEGCFIPEASGDQQMATGMVSGRCAAIDVKNIFLGNFQTLSRAFKKLHENTERTKERKTKPKEMSSWMGSDAFARANTRQTPETKQDF